MLEPVATRPVVLQRRTFIAGVGKGAFALALVSLVGCGSSRTTQAPASAPGDTAGPGATPAGPGATPGGATTAPPTGPATSGPPAGSPPPGGVAWERVNLGFVSAYLLVRDGEAALVDCGVPESSDAIEASLTGIGLDWAAVGSVILTHHHNDHAGSIRTVLNRAAGASAYAGAEDIPRIVAEKPITAVGDGQEVFGLRIVTTPGHTAGSICVYDPIASLLVAGDALRTESGLPTMPGSQFTADMDQARQSVVKLGELTFETLLVGHGDPITSGASGLVAGLA